MKLYFISKIIKGKTFSLSIQPSVTNISSMRGGAFESSSQLKMLEFFNCLDFFCGLVQGYSSHVMSKRQHVTALSSSPCYSHFSLPRWSLSLRGAAIAVPSTAKRSQLFMAFGRVASRCTDRCSLRRAASLTRLKAAHMYRCKHM